MWILPLSVDPAVLDPVAEEHTYTPLIKVDFPPPQNIEDGDTLVFDVLANPKTQQKLIEKIRVSSRSAPFETNELKDSMIMVQGDLTLVPPGWQQPGNTGEPRDYTLDEVKSLLVNPVLSVNGKEVYSGKGVTVFSSMYYIYVPGKGRILLSIYPRLGYPFEKAGVILDKKLSVTLNGENYIVFSNSPILSSGAWNLYILKQPSYEMPGGQGEKYTIGATDKIDE